MIIFDNLQGCQDHRHFQVKPHKGQCKGYDDGHHNNVDYFLLDVFSFYNQLYLNYSKFQYTCLQILFLWMVVIAPSVRCEPGHMATHAEIFCACV